MRPIELEEGFQEFSSIMRDLLEATTGITHKVLNAKFNQPDRNIGVMEDYKMVRNDLIEVKRSLIGMMERKNLLSQAPNVGEDTSLKLEEIHSLKQKVGNFTNRIDNFENIGGSFLERSKLGFAIEDEAIDKEAEEQAKFKENFKNIHTKIIDRASDYIRAIDQLDAEENQLIELEEQFSLAVKNGVVEGPNIKKLVNLEAEIEYKEKSIQELQEELREITEQVKKGETLNPVEIKNIEAFLQEKTTYLESMKKNKDLI